MAYDIITTSVDDATPVELYEFKMFTKTWCRANVDTAVMHNGQTYEPYVISSSDIKSNGDAALSSIQVKVPGDDAVAAMYIVSPPSYTVSLTLFSNHFYDSETRVIWKGRVLSATWDDDGYATLSCESIFASQQRSCLRRRCNINCEFALYGAACGVSAALFQEVTTVSSMTGNIITAPPVTSKPTNYYAGGEVKWIAEYGVVESRTIRSSNDVTGELVLSSMPIGLAPGSPITILPGCDHTYLGVNGCGKFNNQNRYGGAFRLPDANKNPFGGTSGY